MLQRALVTVLALLGAGAAAALSQDRERERAPRTEGALRVLSYNVHGLPSFVTGDDTLARQRAIAPLLREFDVVGLQEDFMDAGHARLLEAAAQPTRRRFAERAGDDRFYGSGLTVLADAPALEDRARHYEAFHGRLTAGADGMASKGFLVVRLELAPGVELDVYDSHLDAGGSEGDEAARAEQVGALIEAMNGFSRGRAVLFLGDTNLHAGGADGRIMRRWLAATGLRCACRAERSSCCGRIDRVLYRSGVGLELSADGWGVAPGFEDAAGEPLSDHAPIEATVRWRRRPV